MIEIKENTFEGLNNLQQLHLNHNQLTEIKVNTFIDLENLQELYLDNNQLTLIKEKAFIRLNILQKLNLLLQPILHLILKERHLLLFQMEPQAQYM